VRYESRKRLADTRPRIRGQFVKAEALLKLQQGEDEEEDEEDEEQEDRMDVEGEERQRGAPPAAQQPQLGGSARHGQGRPQRQALALALPLLPHTQPPQQQQGKHRAAPTQQPQQQLVGAKRRKSTPGRADY
jgi:hypothetical protein